MREGRVFNVNRVVQLHVFDGGYFWRRTADCEPTRCLVRDEAVSQHAKKWSLEGVAEHA